ncbi:MAG TPA: TlpA disulfide reductase family protein [Mucilaginibacter sp.]|jgi:thiol-disulfide isomerase/thioredoxin
MKKINQMKRFKLIGYLLASTLTFCVTVAHSSSIVDTIPIGSQAPVIKGGRWLKGTPFSTYEKGKVYVVEITSRHCSPCAASIPHLTYISEKYKGQVIVLSIYLSENGGYGLPEADTTYISAVNNYVKGNGKKMDFSVVVDDPVETLYKSWGNVSGTPTAFLINKLGKIEWIGSPLDINFEDNIKHMLAGDFNPVEAKQVQEKVLEGRAKFLDAWKNKNYATTLKIIDSLIQIEKVDYTRGDMLSEKFMVLLDSNESAAYVFAAQYLNNGSNDGELLFEMASQIRYRATIKSLKNPNWSLAIALMEKASSINKDKNMFASFNIYKAEIYAAMGNYKKAVEKQKEALACEDKYNKDENSRQLMEKDLVRYQNKL